MSESNEGGVRVERTVRRGQRVTHHGVTGIIECDPWPSMRGYLVVWFKPDGFLGHHCYPVNEFDA